MPTWKKVIVSGSNISQLNNDAGYLTSVTPQAAFVTASVGGVNLIADGANGVLTFDSSSGQGLTISGNSGTDTLTFGLSAIPNSSLANSTISGVALGGTLAALTAGSGLESAGTYTGATARTFAIATGSTHFSEGVRKLISVTDTTGASGIDLTYTQATGVLSATLINSSLTVTAGSGLTGGGAISLGSSATLNIGAGTHITVNADDVAVNTTTLIPAITGSIYSGVSGDIVITSAGVATIQANSVALGTDTTGNYVAGLTAGSGIAVTGTAGEGWSPTVTLKNAASLTNNVLTKWDSTNTQLVNSTITDTGTLVTIANSVNITGDLFVQGNTTQINVQDLYVEDRFIVLASGSATTGDGGLIIDRGSDAAGNVAYGYDSVLNRWGYQNGLTDTTNAITFGALTAGAATNAFAGYVFTEGTHGATKPTSGEFLQLGSIYITTNEDIWMYS